MRLVICDDQAVIRDGLVMLLTLERDIEVLGVAGEGSEAVALAARLLPDLVLMDLKMRGMNGIEATRQIRTQFPSIKVLVLTTYDDDEWLFEAVRAGASGYILKDTPRDELVRAVRGTVEGKSYIDPSVAGKLLRQVSTHHTPPASFLTNKLTEREVAVLRLLGAGCSNTTIANRLSLSEGTVRNHVSAILSKLGVADRTQAAILALEHRLT